MIPESARYDRTMRVVAAFVPPLLLAACASFGADAPGGGGGTDAGADAPPAGEAGADDAGSDGGKTTSGPFCASQTGALFCADFEDGTTNAFSLIPTASAGAGKFEVTSFGGSAALHASFQATQNAQHLYFDQTMLKTLVEPVSIEAEVFLATKLPSTSGQYSFLGLYTSTTGTLYTLDLFGQPEDAFGIFTQTPGGATSTPVAGLPSGQWSSLRAVIDPNTMTGDVFLGPRGQSLPKVATLTPAGTTGTPKGPLRLLVGIQNYGNTPATPALDVYWDNIVVRRQ
jgi:hypothetical protein